MLERQGAFIPHGNLRMSLRECRTIDSEEGEDLPTFFDSDSVSQRLHPVILVSHEKSLEVSYFPEFWASISQLFFFFPDEN